MKIDNNTNKIVLNNYSDHDPDLSNNGGKYAYFEIYTRIQPDTWQRKFEASCGCCPVCGAIEDHWDSEDVYENQSGYTCGEYQTFTTREMEDIIEKFSALGSEEDGYYVTMAE